MTESSRVHVLSPSIFFNWMYGPFLSEKEVNGLQMRKTLLTAFMNLKYGPNFKITYEDFFGYVLALHIVKSHIS